MKALDLFCGLGGWSDGLVMEGFDVVGVEIEPKIAMLYKHRCMVADVRELNGEGFRGFDLIVGSPPCRDFSMLSSLAFRWKKPLDVDNGLSMVNAFLRIVEEAHPKFWLMENVKGLVEHLNLKPRCYPRLAHNMKRVFWGEFPQFLIPTDANHECGRKAPDRHKWIGNKVLASWCRAKIPLPVARALGRAIKENVRGCNEEIY